MGRWRWGGEQKERSQGLRGEPSRLREAWAQGPPVRGSRPHLPAPPSADDASVTLACFTCPFGINLHAGRQTPCTERPGRLPPAVWAEPPRLGSASAIICWDQTAQKGAGASRPAPAVAGSGGCCHEEPRHTERCSCSFCDLRRAVWGALRWAVRGCSGHFPTRLGQEVLVHKTRLRHDKLLDKRGFFFRSGWICLVPQLPAHHRHPWPPDRSRDSGHRGARLLGTVRPSPGRPRPRSSDMDTPPRGSCWTLTDVSAQRQNMEGGFVKRGPGEAEGVQPSSGSVARVSLCYLGVASRHTELGVKWT